MIRLVLISLTFIVVSAQLSTEKCTTPNGQKGQCIVIQQCSELFNLASKLQHLTEEETSFLRSSSCGWMGERPKVCCPLPSKPTATAPPIFAKASYTIDLLPGTDVCGTGSDNRVVGGNATELDEFPWMALLEYQNNKNRAFYCGGVLISQRYVLTAAHCVKGKNIPSNWKLMSVRLGEYDIDKDLDCDVHFCAAPPINIPITDKIVHERYNPNDRNGYNDIALLRLNQDVVFTDFIKPICVPITEKILSQDFSGVNMTVAGWGRTETWGNSNVKLKVQVPVKSNKECELVYGPKQVKITSSQLCAGGDVGKDSCSGDSGGPLMTIYHENANVNWFVTGIVSFGPLICGTKGKPGVYTRTTQYVPWITSKLKP